MLIKALCDYYDILERANKVLPDGSSIVNVSYLVSLTPDGAIDGIIDWRESVIETYGKDKTKEKQVARKIIMPKRTEKPGIEANIIEHRPLYLFGLNLSDDGTFTAEDKTNKAKKSHADFVRSNLDFIAGLDLPVINAYRNFINNWRPENEIDNEYLQALGKGYSTANYAFCLAGRPDLLLHTDEQINHQWRRFFASKDSDGAEYSAQCAISGQTAPIARTHGKIKGIAGGLATGNTFVCINSPAEESYGKKQSYNSNISQTAMEKYTQVLNYLSSEKLHKTTLDDITVLHWAMSENDKYDELYSMFCDNDGADSEQTDAILQKMLSNSKDLSLSESSLKNIDGINPDVDFYIVGIKPNSARIATKFIYHRQFGEILSNIARHQADMQITREFKKVSLKDIVSELKIPNVTSEKPNPVLVAKIYEAIMNNTDYPDVLFATVVRRVKTDRDDEKSKYIKLNYVRAGLIKACLNRKSRLLHNKEEIQLALDINNTNQAYLCGRLFAVLEKLQQDASSNSLNRTIKDAYFASASSTPALIFPKLVKLSQNHLGKAKYPVFYQKLVQEIMDKIEGQFPDTLILSDQGRFIIGYYQQYQNFFEKKENAEEIN